MKTDDCTVIHWIYLCKKKPDYDRAEKCWSMEKFKIHDEEGLGSDFEDDSPIEDVEKAASKEVVQEQITDIINEVSVTDKFWTKFSLGSICYKTAALDGIRSDVLSWLEPLLHRLDANW